MKKSVMKRWVAALRSGKYSQGRGRLRKNETEVTQYCCLGVLCDISKQGTFKRDGITYTAKSERQSYKGMLPPSIIKWAGMSEGGQLPDGRYLWNINDSGTAFTTIADLIEKHYKAI